MANRKPDFIYLQHCRTADEVKDAYRKLAFQFHPDKGGSSANMQQLNAEYEYIKDVKPSLPIHVPATKQTPPRSKPQPKPQPKKPSTHNHSFFTRRPDPDTNVFNDFEFFFNQMNQNQQETVRVPDPVFFNAFLAKHRFMQVENHYKKGWVWFQMINWLKEHDMKIQGWHLSQYAMQMGHSPEWIRTAMGELLAKDLYVI